MSRSRRRRPRLPSPPGKRNGRRSHPGLFAVAVAGVAAAAFLTVVYWPLDDELERMVPKVEQILAVQTEQTAAAPTASRFV